mgnify:FL=1
MALRSAKERIIQTLGFEVGGLLIATPLYALFFESSSGQSLVLLVCISLAVMIWAPMHNTAFDLLDLRAFGRVASDRAHGWRIVHAASLEVTSVALTLPLAMVVGGHSVLQALAVNIGLTLVYTVYGYFYYLVFDLVWPVKARRGEASSWGL